MNETKISKKTVTVNIIWKMAEKMGIQAVSSIVSIVVARFVEPSAYGTIALATAIIAILEIFVDSGLANALVQKKNPDDLDYSTVFLTNVLFCLIFYLVLFAISPLIGKYYNNQELVSIIRVLGLSLIIYGLKDVQHAYITKKMIFKKFFFSSLSGTIVAGLTGIVMAINGFGVWALVATSLLDLLIDTIVIWFTVDWRPKLIFSFNRLKSIYNYSSKLLINSIFGSIYNKVYQFGIAKQYTTADLAFYDKGEGIPVKLVGNLTNALNAVIQPVLSNYQDNSNDIKRITKLTIKTSTYIMVPMLIGISVIAEPLVRITFTEKWLPMVPYIRIMCGYEILINLININGTVFRTKGRSDMVLKYCTIIEIIGLALLFLTIKYGVIILAIIKVLTTLIQYCVFTYGTNKLIDYSLKEQILDILPYIFIGLFMGLITISITLFNLNDYVTLIIQILIGIISYIGLSYIFKIDSFLLIKDIAINMINKRH